MRVVSAEEVACHLSWEGLISRLHATFVKGLSHRRAITTLCTGPMAKPPCC